MTVNVDQGKVTYLGNGSTTTFAFPFSTPDAGSIHILVEDIHGNVTEQSPGAFSIVLNPLVGANPTPTGGTVTYPVVGSPLPVGTSLTIVRELQAIQPVSLSNQSIIYPPVIEKELDYLTMLDQGGSEELSRAFRVGFSDPIPKIVPSVAIRAQHTAFFNTDGDMVPGEIPGPGVFISAVMIPVVEAATLAAARAAMGIRSAQALTSAYGISSGDSGVIFSAAGNALYTISLGAASGFPADFTTFIFNNDSRGKTISISGKSPFILWPTQLCIISPDGVGGWQFSKSGRWRSMGSVQFNVDYANGTDSGDGLGTLAQAFKTIQFAIGILETQCDGNFSIKLADGTHQVGTSVTCNKPLIGADGYSITGNVSAPGNVILQADSGGTCFVARDNAVLTLQGVTFQAPNGSCVFATAGAIINIGNVKFGPSAGGIHMFVDTTALINVNGPYSVAQGGAAYHMAALTSGFIKYNPGTVTFEGTMTFSIAFIDAIYNATILTGGPSSVSFVNAAFVNGQQYTVSHNSVVTLSGNTCPGTIAGVTNTGGIFD